MAEILSGGVDVDTGALTVGADPAASGAGTDVSSRSDPVFVADSGDVEVLAEAEPSAGEDDIAELVSGKV
ncbi:MAG: hypothetical protein ACFCBU_12390, partial [Cyanophyceae cyanobacterium]